MSPDTNNIGLIDIDEVRRTLGLRSKTSIYNLMENNAFPRPVAIGLRAKRWISAEVQAWIAARIQAQRGVA